VYPVHPHREGDDVAVPVLPTYRQEQEPDMSARVQIYAAGKKAGQGKPDRDVGEVIDGIAAAIKREAEELAKAGYTIDPDTIRLGTSFGSYDITMEATR
jgi:hypothetical protein